jgi:hypothetical protein
MRAHRIISLVAATGAMVAAVAGAALISPGVACAAPAVPAVAAYPAPPPSLTVSSPSVTTGRTVRVLGNGFVAGERVAVVLRYRITLRSAGFGPVYAPHISGGSRADDQGKVHARVTLTVPGYATVTVRGLRSHKSASVTIRVSAWRSSWPWPFFFGGGSFDGSESGFRVANAAFGSTVSGSTVSGSTVDAGGSRLVANEASLNGSGSLAGGSRGVAPEAQLLAGLLGVTALVGSGLLTFRTLRRRRADGTL